MKEAKEAQLKANQEQVKQGRSGDEHHREYLTAFDSMQSSFTNETGALSTAIANIRRPVKG
jgi:hypothetical protein